ncbi:MAG: aldo/keto reductase [Planctomycetota bacterium]
MPLDHYLTLGRSGLRVSPLCLGTMTFGEEWGWGSTREDSERIIAAYMDKGGNFLDTANIYTKGHSEVIIGDYFKNTPRHASNNARDRAVIATKFMGNLYPGDPNGGGAGRKGVIGACEESLRRLRTDYIDLYWMHFSDPHTPIEETMRALDDLVRSGKVRYIGFSDTPAWRCAQAQTHARMAGLTPLIALQIEYSLLERTPEHELLPMAIDQGLGITPWSPLKSGRLTDKYRRGYNRGEGEAKREWVKDNVDDKTLDLLDLMATIGERHTETGKPASVAQVALAWCLAKPGVESPIIGARTMEQLEANLDAVSFKLDAEDIAALDEATKPAPIFPGSFLPMTTNVVQGGMTVNDRPSEAWEMAPKSNDDRF